MRWIHCCIVPAVFAATHTLAGQTVVVDGTLFRLGGTVGVGQQYPEAEPVTTTVDHVYFTVHSASTVDFDILSWESTSFGFDPGAPSDRNGDGEIAFFDPTIFLYRDDGSLSDDDYVSENDDGETLGLDNSIRDLDSYLSESLSLGDYVLAIGAYSLDGAEPLSSSSMSRGPATHRATDAEPITHTHGDWQLTITGDVTVTRVEPGRRADFDADGDVDGDDFLVWQASFETDAGGDANGDGATDGDDFLLWQAEFEPAGRGASGRAVSVPEPTSLWLLASCVALLVGSRQSQG